MSDLTPNAQRPFEHYESLKKKIRPGESYTLGWYRSTGLWLWPVVLVGFLLLRMSKSGGDSFAAIWFAWVAILFVLDRFSQKFWPM